MMRPTDATEMVWQSANAACVLQLRDCFDRVDRIVRGQLATEVAESWAEVGRWLKIIESIEAKGPDDGTD